MIASQLAVKYELHIKTITNRFKALGVETKMFRKYNKNEIDLLLNYKGKKRGVKKINSPNKIDIIELFLSSPDNRDLFIARKLNLNLIYVSVVIREYLKNKTITVESKL
jgi:hypothetical protein